MFLTLVLVLAIVLLVAAVVFTQYDRFTIQGTCSEGYKTCTFGQGLNVRDAIVVVGSNDVYYVSITKVFSVVTSHVFRVGNDIFVHPTGSKFVMDGSYNKGDSFDAHLQRSSRAISFDIPHYNQGVIERDTIKVTY